MIFGVPLVPFASALALCVLLSTWINILMVFIMIPIYFVMKVITKKDDQQFRLIFLKMIFLMPSFKTYKFWKASASTPISFKKSKKIQVSRKKIKG